MREQAVRLREKRVGELRLVNESDALVAFAGIAQDLVTYMEYEFVLALNVLWATANDGLGLIPDSLVYLSH